MAAKKRLQKKTAAAAKPAARAPDDAVETAPPVTLETSTQDSGPPVAGIGASAGGLDALKKLFASMPADTGISFVVVPHLDPTHESLMVELLARHTPMPVLTAAEGMCVQANSIYVIPPNKYITIAGGMLHLTGPVDRVGPQTAIDTFLRSLAEDKQHKAICIILSGNGSHGTLGLKAVKAGGGLAVVQDPATADYPLMPQSAIATGLADFVLPVDRMAEPIIKYVQHDYVNGAKPTVGADESIDDLHQILSLIRVRTKLDFRSYRKQMLWRRIERRMSLTHFDRIADYVEYLRQHADELKRLCRDLLISVTSFFRDPKAWSALETEVIGPLIRAKDPEAPIRVWSVGSATGEEPYSLGMTILDYLAVMQKQCSVQIFATDVDEDAIETARRGIYPESIAADVSPERLARHFTRVSNSSYQVSKQLREIVTFARQNLITDAPFSKMDLIVCRNLLIYLEPELQGRVIEILHFALNPGGTLFLGPSETVGRNIDLFEAISAKWRIYRRVGPSRANHLNFPPQESAKQPARAAPAARFQPPPRLAEFAQGFLLRRFALACVVINRNHQVLHFAGPTENFLAQPPGPPTSDLLSLVRPGLESKLRVAIQRAIRENEAYSVDDVLMRHSGAIRRVSMEVEPLTLSDQSEGLLLVAFQEHSEPKQRKSRKSKVTAQSVQSDLVHQLQRELEATREDLQSTIEELESSNEELKASNEEIMSMNEELQSTNEELETSKEELQSVNEELSTVNNQLQDKIQELESANNDMANLFNATDIATVILDTKFHIRRFTPAATRLFKLILTDVGRPLSDIVRRFADEDLLDEAARVLEILAPSENEVRTDDGRWCARRIIPYRTLDDRIDGVVISFVDITDRKLAANAMTGRLAALVEGSADAIISKDPSGIVRTWNHGAERLYGYAAKEVVGKSIRMIIPDDRIPECDEATARLLRHEHVELETERVQKSGQRIPVLISMSPIRGEDGMVATISVIARDISERKRHADALRDREERLRAILNTALDAFITIDRSGIIQSVNPATSRMFGYADSELVGKNVSMLMPPPYREEHDSYLARYLQTGEKRIIGIGREAHGRRKDGTVFPVDLAVGEIEHLKLFTGMIRDITRRKELEREVIEIASLQQRRIGQDLHDSVGQELTALNMVANDLNESLRNRSRGTRPLIDRVVRGLQRCQQDLRNVIQGLLPVPVDAQGLMAALAELAEQTQKETNITCTFECPTPVGVMDNLTAAHLYLIAQEAVHNAVKHARAGNIRISLHSNGTIALAVQDDGTGMPAVPAENQGLGLRIIQNRASLLGAKLTIGAAQPSGTVVSCVLPRKNHGPT